MKRENAQLGHDIRALVQTLDAQFKDVRESILNTSGNEFWTRFRNEILETSSNLHQSLNRDAVIASLHYDYMDVREDAIQDAYGKTFDWIYRAQSDDASAPRCTVRFAEWLQRSSGIYWVTGKPGEYSPMKAFPPIYLPCIQVLGNPH